MGNLTRAVAVVGLVLASAVAGVSTSTPASAAPVQCTQTFRSNGGSQQSVQVFVPPHTWLSPDARVTDVDVRVMGQTLGNTSAQLNIILTHEREADLYRSGFQEVPPYATWDLTFDDEAGSLPAPSQTNGRVRPVFPLAIHDSDPAQGLWYVMFEAGGGSGFQPQGVELTITTLDCDSDGDGVPQTADNCPTVANADQTDWDADGVGNACDSTPGTAPVTPTPGPTTTPTVPPTTTPPGCTSSCTYARTVGLRLQVRKHRLEGRVESVAVGCRSGVSVALWHQRKGQDRKLVVLTTKADGSYRTRAPRRAGRYYTQVGSPDEPLCGTDRSRTVKIERR